LARESNAKHRNAFKAGHGLRKEIHAVADAMDKHINKEEQDEIHNQRKEKVTQKLKRIELLDKVEGQHKKPHENHPHLSRGEELIPPSVRIALKVYLKDFGECVADHNKVSNQNAHRIQSDKNIIYVTRPRSDLPTNPFIINNNSIGIKMFVLLQFPTHQLIGNPNHHPHRIPTEEAKEHCEEKSHPNADLFERKRKGDDASTNRRVDKTENRRKQPCSFLCLKSEYEI
jgi:hypothetical protein